MKPRRRPGKVTTGGKSARTNLSRSKPLTRAQMDHLRREVQKVIQPGKAGRGGKRADWQTDYAEGVEYASRFMPCREDQCLSQDGVRRARKRGH